MRHDASCVATSFGVHPPAAAASRASAGLYGALARLGVESRSSRSSPATSAAARWTIAPGVRETAGAAHGRARAAPSGSCTSRAGVPVGDLGARAAPRAHAGLRRGARRRVAGRPTAVVACHPSPHAALAGAPDLPLIYEAQDVETDLKASMYAGPHAGRELAERGARARGRVLRGRRPHARLLRARTARGCGELFGAAGRARRRGAQRRRSRRDPVHAARRRARAPARARPRRRARSRSSSAPGTSRTWPPSAICSTVADELRRARASSSVGSAGLAFADEPMPANVDLCGVVDAGFVRSVLGRRGRGAEPDALGLGTNLKMLDYALAGVPLVSTRVRRARGRARGRRALLSEAEELAAGLQALRARRPPEADRRAHARRRARTCARRFALGCDRRRAGTRIRRCASPAGGGGGPMMHVVVVASGNGVAEARVLARGARRAPSRTGR